MSELVNVISLDNPYISFPMDRKTFYSEQVEEFQKNGKPTKAVEIVSIFLFNKEWQLILQKRSNLKSHNANLMDKSIWWHIDYWNSPNFTAMLETVQELQVPSIVLNNDDDFDKTLKLLSNYTATISVIKNFWTQLVHIDKIIDWKNVEISNKVHLYIWVYDWSIRNVDKEAKGVLFYYLDELDKEIETFPNTFTWDLIYYMKNYREYFEDFVKQIKKV